MTSVRTEGVELVLMIIAVMMDNVALLLDSLVSLCFCNFIFVILRIGYCILDSGQQINLNEL